MAGRSDKVEEGMHTIVAETGVTLDTRLLGENIIVLSLEIANNFAKARVSSVLYPILVFPSVSYLASLSI
jgi:hypothetical protein